MVKCSDCGFLAFRDRGNRELYEAEAATRETGTLFLRSDLTTRWSHVPVCFVRAHPLRKEMEDLALSSGATPESLDNLGVHAPAPYVLAVVSKERDCPADGEKLGFTPWQQGFTPKEHREMMDRERMLQWQADRERRDREFRNREGRANRKYRLIELGLVIITIVAVILAAFIEKSGQPIINNYITPSTSGTGGTPP